MGFGLSLSYSSGCYLPNKNPHIYSQLGTLRIIYSLNVSSFHHRNIGFWSEFATSGSKQKFCYVNLVSKVNLAYSSSLRAAFTLSWALEQNPLSNESEKETMIPNLGDEQFEDQETERFVSVNSKEINQNNKDFMVNCEDEDEREADGKNPSLVESEAEKASDIRNGRVNVHALAMSLQFAERADDVEEVLGDMDLPPSVYSSMIRGFGMAERLKPAIALVEWLKRGKKSTNGGAILNLYIYNSLLGAAKASHSYEKVGKIIEDMEKQGILPNIVTLNTLMSVYLEQGKTQEARDIFSEIPRNGLSPSPVTYSTVLQIYRKMEDAKGALEFFVESREKYKKGEIENDSCEDWENEFAKLENFTIRICYQVMRGWLVKGGGREATDVLKLLIELDKAGLKPGRAIYERLIWACTNEGHYIVAKELYQRIRENNTEISLSVCNHVIWLMGKAKKWWASLEVYEEMLDKGPKPNNLSYELMVSQFNILLSAASRRGIWNWAIRLLNKMQEKGIKPRTREWNAALVACSRASEAAAAVQIFMRMVEQGEKPTILSYGALLSALEKGKLYDKAHQVWEHMIKVGVQPNLYAYTTMLSIYIKQGRLKAVDIVIREMNSLGIEPTVVTFNAIISGCAYKGMGGAAFEWFHRMKAKNIEPNEITYEMLIEALANDGKPRLAYEVYLRARNEDLLLSPKAYDSVLRSSYQYKASIDMSRLGPRPPEKTKKRTKVSAEFCRLPDMSRREKPLDSNAVYKSQPEEIHQHNETAK
ncbi:pentatricopeptide repeat-containing protein At3g46610 [Amborella trichopoda]|uniref:pentatricopeptide repeat-containing protein At3g46610 n=1 Tax=Amborella trichopoda TaxID=13333 RepID=UPI0005D41B3C|nr:pentatricopeptide repeat-containing protein At3g46610 [Amborella trichopoda]|eukprot:XP_011626165.1 pentatricopeptide repeat-containing protein At3g46610 [Amborella trichopoda]